MTRAVFILAAAALVVAALRLPAPPSADPSGDGAVLVEEYRLQQARFVTCPWALADGRRSSAYLAAAESPSGFDMSFVEGGAVKESRSGEVTEGSRVVRIDNPREVGITSALVEFAQSDGAVGVVAFGEGLLAGDLCTASLPATWHLPGGSTLGDEELTLRLFNPFTTDARVDLWALSELGTEAAESLEALTVPGGRTRVVSLDEVLVGRESLAIIVRPTQGSVIPVMELDAGADTAVWPGTGSSEGWEFPVAGVEGLRTSLVLTNEASLEVNFVVELFGDASTSMGPLTGTIDGPGQVRIELDGLPASAFGVRVTGDGPFGAALVGRSGTAIAATSGTPVNNSEWLLLGPRAAPADARLHFLNAGVVDLEVTYTALTASGEELQDPITLAAGSVETVAVTNPDVVGVRVSGSGPFSAGWWAEAQGSVVFAGGVPVG